MLIQKHLSEEDVICNFSDKINDYCEQFYHENDGKILRTSICQKMIKKFSGRIKHDTWVYGDDWLRKQINVKYKLKKMVIAGQKRGMSLPERIKFKINDLESQLLEATNGTLSSMRNDFR